MGFRCVTVADELAARRRADRSLGDAVFSGCGSPPECARSFELDPSSLSSKLIAAYAAAPDVDFTTSQCGRPQPPVRPPGLTRLLERIRVLPPGPVRKKLKSEANIYRRRYRRERVEWECPPTRRKVRHRIKHLVVDGRETGDREEWKDELDKFCRKTLSSKEVREDSHKMLEEIKGRAEEEIRLTSIAGINMALLARARARLKTRRATGPDRVPCEILKILPWSVLRKIRHLFDNMLRLSSSYPSSWRDILISCMPKIPGLTNLKDGRLLCMQNALARWYTTCIVVRVEEHVEHTGLFRPLGIYGFQADRTTHEITASIKHIGQHASTWGREETAHMANADILQAFDHCTVHNVRRGLDHAAVPAYLQLASLDPLCDSLGTICYDGLEVEGVEWDMCIRTGGPEGPLAFNLIVAAMWQETFREWDRLKIGYRVEFVSGTSKHTTIMNHFIWADNCYAVERSSRERFMILLSDYTRSACFGNLLACSTWSSGLSCCGTQMM